MKIFTTCLSTILRMIPTCSTPLTSEDEGRREASWNRDPLEPLSMIGIPGSRWTWPSPWRLHFLTLTELLRKNKKTRWAALKNVTVLLQESRTKKMRSVMYVREDSRLKRWARYRVILYSRDRQKVHTQYVQSMIYYNLPSFESRYYVFNIDYSYF